MKKGLLLLSLLPIFISCNDNEDSTANNNTPITEAYQYPVVPRMPEWAEFHSSEAMWEACQIPNDILIRLSTKALVETCMHFPLRGDYLVMNNPRNGISFQIENFSGLLELTKRKDASIELIKYYQNFQATTIEEEFDLLYLESLIADPTFINAMTSDELYQLRDRMIEVCLQKLKDGPCSLFKISPSYWLDEEIANRLNIPPSILRSSILGYITLYTPKGSHVTELIIQEGTSKELTNADKNLSPEYPEATFKQTL